MNYWSEQMVVDWIKVILIAVVVVGLVFFT